MSAKKLILDDFFEEEEKYSVIGIHCSLDDYRLAFVLNTVLDINLKRCRFNLDFAKTKASYSIFEYYNTKQQTTYNLVLNTCKIENTVQQNNNDDLFATINTTMVYNLIPEYKQVNYILKITGDTVYNKQKIIINTLLKVPQIITAYSLNLDKIKHKDHLIF